MKHVLPETLASQLCSYGGTCKLPTHRFSKPPMLPTLTHALHSQLAPNHVSPSLQTAANPKLATVELKFLVPTTKRELLLTWVDSHMGLDPHCKSAAGYQVQSLYLDTPSRDVLNHSGICRGTKYRIRRYDCSSQVFLERKSKLNSQLTKKRIPMDLERLLELDQLSKPQVGAPVSVCDNWFYQDAHRLRLQPVVLVQYQRQAFFLDTEHNALRLTIDSNLLSAACDSQRFADQCWRTDSSSTQSDSRIQCHDDPIQFVTRDHMVVELKFFDSIPSLFKQLLSEFQIEPIKFSKYRTAMLSRACLPIDDNAQQADNAQAADNSIIVGNTTAGWKSC